MKVISAHGGRGCQFISHDFARVNQQLGIRHEMYQKGHLWFAKSPSALHFQRLHQAARRSYR